MWSLARQPLVSRLPAVTPPLLSAFGCSLGMWAVRIWGPSLCDVRVGHSGEWGAGGCFEACVQREGSEFRYSTRFLNDIGSKEPRFLQVVGPRNLGTRNLGT